MDYRMGFLLAALLFSLGCAEDDGKRTVYPVDAALTMDGEAFGPITIRLEPLDKEIGRSVVGQADEAGNIRFTTYKAGDGVPAGMYRVVVGTDMFAPPQPYPAVYRDQTTSPLEIEVMPEKGQTLEVAMDSEVGGAMYAGSPTGPGHPDMSAAYQGDAFKAGVKSPADGNK